MKSVSRAEIAVVFRWWLASILILGLLASVLTLASPALAEEQAPSNSFVVLDKGDVVLAPLMQGGDGKIESFDLGWVDKTVLSDYRYYAPNEAVLQLSGREFDAALGEYSTLDKDVLIPPLPGKREQHLTGANGRILFGVGLVSSTASNPFNGVGLNASYQADIDDEAGPPEFDLRDCSTTTEGSLVVGGAGVGDVWNCTSAEGGQSTVPLTASKVGEGTHYMRATVPGVYCLTVDLSVKSRANGTLWDAATYTIVVGQDVPADLTPCAQRNVTPPDGVEPGDPDEYPWETITMGHHDVRAGIVDNELALGLNAELTPWDDFVIARTPPSRTVPAPSTSSDLTAIGPEGTPFWYFPTSSTSPENYVWPGFSTESIAGDQLLSPLTFSLNGFSRNGVVNPDDTDVALLFPDLPWRHYEWLSTRRGFPSTFQLGTHVHAHPMWAFTQPGVYCLSISVAGQLADGHWSDDTGLLTMAVGDHADPRSVEPCAQQGISIPVPGPLATPNPISDDRFVTDGSFFGSKASLVSFLQDGQLEVAADVAATGGQPDHYVDVEKVIFRPEWRTSQGDGREVSIQLDNARITPLLADMEAAVRLSLGNVGGPGAFGYRNLNAPSGSTGLSSTDPARGSTTLPIASRAQSNWWDFSAAGVYCVPLTWGVTLPSGAETVVSKTLTFAVGSSDPGSPAFVDAEAVIPCVDGGEPTPPGNGPDPSDELWNVPNGSPTDSGATILNNGHVDVASLLDGTEFDTKVVDDTAGGGPIYRDTDATVLQLLPDSRTTVPTGENYSFLGAHGAPLWQINQTQQPGLLWPGWSTESIPVPDTAGGVNWKLEAVHGPGEFFIYQTTSFGEVQRILSSPELATAYTIPKNTHAHGNWAFTQEGVYCLDFTRSATLTEGDQAVSDEFTLAVVVGETDPRQVDPVNCEGSEAPDPEPEPTAPAAPAKPDITADGSTVEVTWAAPADGGSPITGYTVTLTPAEGTPLTKHTAAGATSVSFIDVAVGTWTATVKATNTVGSSDVSPASEPVTVTGTPDPDPAPVATMLTAAAITQTYGKTAKLAISVSPNATGTVNVKIGSKTVVGTLSKGMATVTVPKMSLNPGERTVAITYAGVSGKFKPAAGMATVNVAMAKPVVRVKRVRSTVKRGKTATLQVTVTGSGVSPSGKITVEVAWKRTTVKLNPKGKATVRITVPRSTKTGKKAASVSYSGDTFVAKGETKTKIRVTR